MLRKTFFIYIILILAFPFTIMGQEISPKGEFNADSLRLGEPVIYSLSVRYPKNMQLIFPDSTFNYYPFEYIKKSYSPTRSDSLFSFDSVAFTLSTFEIFKTQSLALPVYLLSAGDSVPIVADPDSVFLVEVVQQASDTLSLQEDLRFREVPLEFNYPYLLFGVLGFVIVILGTHFIFGRIIIEKIKRYKLKRAHNRFKQKYFRMLEELKNNKHINPEEILIIWKKYMEELEGLPYTKQTSTEIVMNAEHESLKNSLRAIDKSIYGDIWDQNLIESFQLLSEYSEGRYNSKVQEVIHE